MSEKVKDRKGRSGETVATRNSHPNMTLERCHLEKPDLSRSFLISAKPKTTQSPDIKPHYRRKIKRISSLCCSHFKQEPFILCPTYAQISLSCLSARKGLSRMRKLMKEYIYIVFKITRKRGKVRGELDKPSLQV